MLKKLLANHKNQDLSKHLYATAELSEKIASKQTKNSNIQKAAFVSGYLHDIGKIDPHFQKWLSTPLTSELDNGAHIDSGKFSFEKHARHNEISTYLLSFIVGKERTKKRQFLKDNGFSSENTALIDIIAHATYWHHAKPLRKEEFLSLGTIHKKSIKEDLVGFIHTLDELLANSDLPREIKTSLAGMTTAEIDDIRDDIISDPLPPYKRYRVDNESLGEYRSDIEFNAHCNIVRSSVITADRIVSALSSEELDAFIALMSDKDISEETKTNSIDSLINHNGSVESLINHNDIENNTLLINIKNHSDSFHPNTLRSIDQRKCAEDLTKSNGVAVLSGAAGCGKTKIGIEWALRKGAKKLYWIVPRVSVGQSVFEELSSKDYLANSEIELYTGELKITRLNDQEYPTPETNYLSGKVVITTIDQLVSSATTHKGISMFTDFMLNHAVFDEYHEYANMNAFNLFFSEIISSKQCLENDSNTLLISATPNYYFVNNLLNIESSEIIEMKSSNKNKFKFVFESFDDDTPNNIHPLFRPIDEGTIVITNTATNAQSGFIMNYNEPDNALFHSKLGSEDKQAVFKKVLDSFQKNGSKKITRLRAAPIVQASLNITCETMTSEATTPENLLQRMGRLDRFAESIDTNVYTIAVPKSVDSGKCLDSNGRFLNSMNSFKTTCEWIKYLKLHAIDEVSIEEIYQIYSDFYKNHSAQSIIEIDILAALKESIAVINAKLNDPLWVKPKNSKKELLKKTSLRGNSRFVQMANLQFESGKFNPTGGYAISTENQMTCSINEIDGSESPLEFMFKNHHKIKQFADDGEKKKHHISVLMDKSRSPEYPIYTSYTQEHLNEINSINSEKSIFYVTSEKQPIGAMRSSQIESINQYH